MTDHDDYPIDATLDRLINDHGIDQLTATRMLWAPHLLNPTTADEPAATDLGPDPTPTTGAVVEACRNTRHHLTTLIRNFRGNQP